MHTAITGYTDQNELNIDGGSGECKGGPALGSWDIREAYFEKLQLALSAEQHKIPFYLH